MEQVVTVTGIRKNYAGEHALKGVSFSIERGMLYGVIGADGAGKTTLMRILSTLLAADEGEALILGKDIRKDLNAIRSGIGYMPQKFSLYQDLSVRENLLFFADVYGVKKRERDERMKRLLSFSRLDGFQNRRAAHLSGGMKQKLALSCALIHTPDILFLDEPTTGVDPVSRNEFWTILKELKNQGITILTSTPYMDEADMCDSLLILHKGEVLRKGSPEELVSGYPYRVYRISSPTATITCSRETKLPEGFAAAYPTAGFIHAVVKDVSFTDEKIFSSVKSFAPDADRVEQVAPGIEDLFFLLITEREESEKV